MVLSHWIRTCAGNHQFAHFKGPAALGMYRALGDKHVLAKRDYPTNNMGCPTREEVDVCGAFGYVYGQDARPDYQLALMSITEATTNHPSWAYGMISSSTNTYSASTWTTSACPIATTTSATAVLNPAANRSGRAARSGSDRRSAANATAPTLSAAHPADPMDLALATDQPRLFTIDG